MSNFYTAPRPAGQTQAYLFVKKTEQSDQMFKVTKVIQENAAGDQVVTLGISATDENGVALKSLSGEPDVTYISHTFTTVELTRPNFDAQEALNEQIEKLLDKKIALMEAIEMVKNLGGDWS